LENDDYVRLSSIFDSKSAVFSDLARAAKLDPKTDFRFSNLSGVDFRGSDLRGYNFQGSNLTFTKWGGAKRDRTTILDQAITDGAVGLSPGESEIDTNIYNVAQNIYNAAHRAAGSSFYGGMRILPRPQREAMFEIYAFCRAVDDIADDPGPRDARRGALQHWRADIDLLYAGAPPPQLRGLAQAVRTFDLQHADFLAVIDGMEMDVAADIRAPDRPTLELYCDRVACAVGRLSVRVFGMERDAGLALADQLGRALQLTNILRDLDEDGALGRLYLPRDALRDAGIISTDPQTVLANPMLGEACGVLVELAWQHFAKSRAIMAQVPRRTVRAPRIMAEAYGLILDRLVARGFAPPRKPVRLPRSRLVLAVLRNLM
jgi:presqualene diphosphate synthase